MMDKKIRKIIRQETEIPEVVELRVMETLNQICSEKRAGDVGRDGCALPESSRMRTSGDRAGERSDGLGMARFLKAAALTLVVLAGVGTSAYAAARYFGIWGFLGERGMSQTQQAETLLRAEGDGRTFSNDYVNYTVREALCDSELIYMVIEAEPKTEEYLLVPQYCMEEDSVSELNIEGVAEGTIGAYAEKTGKKIMYSGVGLFQNGELVSTTETSKAAEDGTVYYCITGTNGSGEASVELTCVGTAYTAGMSVANRAELQYTLTDRSTGVTSEYALADRQMETDTGLLMDEIEIFETELGMYVTCSFHIRENAGLSDSLSFEFMDADGTPLASMPYYAGGGRNKTETEDGNSYTETLAYQKTDLQAGLSVSIRDLETDLVYGPYTLEAAEQKQ